MKYNPSDAAKACNVSVNTIRGWIRDFADHFTPEARGESGNRLLSDKDLNTLKYIAALRSEGLQRDAIGLRLQETSIGETETLIDVQKPAIALQSPQNAPEAAALPLVALDAISKRIDAIETAGKADKSQHGTAMFALGFIAACVLFLIIVLLISIYHR